MSDLPRPYGFTRRPEPRSLGNAVRGQEVVAGRLRLPGAEVSGDPFAKDAVLPVLPDPAAAALHGFGWLDDVAAVGLPPARDLAQKRVLDWIAAHPGPSDDTAWRTDVAARRMLRWIFHSGQIMPGLDRDAAQPVFDSLHAHLDHLSTAETLPGQPGIEALSARALSAMLLRDAEAHVAPALAALADAVAPNIREGVLRARCPEAALSCLSHLGWVQTTAAETGHDLPAEIALAIGELAPVIRALRHADGGLPRFHGGGRGVPGRLDHSLRAANGPATIAPGHAMGFARLTRARASVVLDAAPPPAGAGAAQAHASTLAFEFTSGRHPIVVNCGSGRRFGTAWARASRATACHSTLSLSGLSSAKLLPPDASGHERLTLLPQHVWAGACDAEGNVLPPDSATPPPRLPAQLLAGHDAWLGTHGLSHLRELYLAPAGDELRGEDTLAALDIAAQGRLAQALTNHRDGIGFEIRFHLHPELDVQLDGDAVRIELPGAEEWYFSHDLVASLSLEPSAYLENALPEPRAAMQIVLSHRLISEAVQIGWTFMRAGVT